MESGKLIVGEGILGNLGRKHLGKDDPYKMWLENNTDTDGTIPPTLLVGTQSFELDSSDSSTPANLEKHLFAATDQEGGQARDASVSSSRRHFAGARGNWFVGVRG